MQWFQTNSLRSLWRFGLKSMVKSFCWQIEVNKTQTKERHKQKDRIGNSTEDVDNVIRKQHERNLWKKEPRRPRKAKKNNNKLKTNQAILNINSFFFFRNTLFPRHTWYYFNRKLPDFQFESNRLSKVRRRLSSHTGWLVMERNGMECAHTEYRFSWNASFILLTLKVILFVDDAF